MMNSGQHPLISVIIVSYNVKDFVCAGIESVKKYCTIPYEVIVIDNASVDGTEALIKSKYPDVTFIANKHNAGFSGANNQGFAIAKGEWLLMLNPDAELIDANITQAIDYLTKQDKPTLIGPKVENPDGSLQASAWKFQGVFAHLLEALFLNKLIDPLNYPLATYTSATEVDSISGACILMKKELVVKMGGLDENLFWMDDVDLCYRVKKEKGKSIYFPTWKVKHYVGESSKKNQSLVISNQIISKLKFYRKHRQYINFILSILVFQLHILLRILILLPLSIINTGLWRKCKAYLFTQKRFFQYLFLNKQSVA
ncbi:MAG TPA: glycosyltransferase family 2 protein [Bacteroidia bacterium]